MRDERIFIVIRTYGPPYNAKRPLEAQPEWEAHRVFMNALEAEGTVRLGGPLEGAGEVLLIRQDRIGCSGLDRGCRIPCDLSRQSERASYRPNDASARLSSSCFLNFSASFWFAAEAVPRNAPSKVPGIDV